MFINFITNFRFSSLSRIYFFVCASRNAIFIVKTIPDEVGHSVNLVGGCNVFPKLKSLVWNNVVTNWYWFHSLE